MPTGPDAAASGSVPLVPVPVVPDTVVPGTVTPETEAPAAAAAIFGPVLPLAEQYAGLLTGPAVERGLLGPAEAGRIWERHLLNCAAVAELTGSPGTLIDLGSGAGLPGIVLALLLPGTEVILLEPMARRVAFLGECVRALGLANAEVCRGRAQDMAGRLTADVVVARAVAPLDKLAPMAAALARPGGTVLAIKGAGADDELSRARPVLARLGARDADVIRIGGGKVDPAATVVRFVTGPARTRSGRQPAPGMDGYRPAGRGGTGAAARGQQRRPNARRSGG